VLLSAPADVLLRRIKSRTTNDYGKSIDERDRIVSDISAVELLLQASCTHEIDATQSLLRLSRSSSRSGRTTP
jgi:hypothetical protein